MRAQQRGKFGHVTANSRVVAQAQTRRRIKQVAREMMLADGYAAASISAIAAEAGYTPGAFYSNFASKADLGLEILQELQDEATEELNAIFADGSSQSARIDHLQAWIDKTLSSGWPRMELEFGLAARDTPAVIAAEGSRNRDAVARVAERLTTVLPAWLVDDDETVRLLAEVVLDLAFGIAVRRLVAPEVTPTYVFKLLSRLRSGIPPAPV